MALIYASAVNKRMHQLQKKRSVDIPTQHHEMAAAQLKKRSQQEEQLRRENSADLDRKRSFKCTAKVNRVDSGSSSTNGGGHPSAMTASMYAAKKSGGEPNGKAAALAIRKITIAAMAQADERRKAPPLRKNSTPTMFTQSVIGLPAREECVTMAAKKRAKKICKEGTPISGGSEESAAEQTQQRPKKSSSAGGGHRRRSVSVDEVLLFRVRGGTNSSIDSGGSPAEGSPVQRKTTTTLQKMRERLNKWKLSS